MNVLWKHFLQMETKKKSPGLTLPINYDDIFHYLIKLLTAAFQKQALEVILHKIQDCQQESVGFFVSHKKLLTNLGYSNGKKKMYAGLPEASARLKLSRTNSYSLSVANIATNSAKGRPPNI